MEENQDMSFTMAADIFHNHQENSLFQPMQKPSRSIVRAANKEVNHLPMNN
jgi:hypothetical protein